ncbi:c-type cytochrome [Reinekea sp. G2M2-21]|uniref:c-type cytochrome n=1 Tax=Reinekea sp. G2M2-21 TaxID=2788942 RepID=UPI0018AB7DBE|nr:c-type cytochrome [Reinekea sp. G2M2-21]
MNAIRSTFWILKGLLVASAILLSSCSQQYGGDGERAAVINEKGREIYNEQCSSCHGPNGEGGSGGGLIGCATCGAEESLIAKIERDMPSAKNPLHGDDAANVSEYIIAAFNESASGQVQRSLPGVSTMTAHEAVYKLAFELAGRLPTDDEVALFTRDLEGEKEVVYGFMETDYFYERLKDMFNDSLLTDRFRPENADSRNPLNSLYNNSNDGFRAKINPTGSRNGNNLYNVFPDIDGWYGDLQAEAMAAAGDTASVSNQYLEFFTLEAISRKPLLLVEYLARNNRDFREYVSGKYTVANAFSFQAFTRGDNGPNMKVVDPDKPLGNGASAIVSNPQWRKWSSGAEMLDYLDVINLYASPVGVGDLSQGYILRDFPYDPRDIKAVQLYYNDENGVPQYQGVPHSGVITDEIFLNKYTATETNMHRNRARMIYWFFAAKDLLAIEGNRDAAQLEFEDFGNNVGVVDPTNTNPDCAVCHDVMDPVAKAFEDYDLNGIYDPRNPDLMQSHDGAIGWGLSKAQIATTGSITGNYNNRELQWLGEQLAADPAYSRGIAQIMVKGMTGQDVLGEPSLESPDEYRQAYSEQARLISSAASEFAGSNFNIKALIYAISKSAYYRATNITSDILMDDYSHIGSIRYIQPQLLNQKLRALNSGGWGVSSGGVTNAQTLSNISSRLLLGGKDSIDKLTDVDSVGGIIASALDRMAVEESCDIVRAEFNNTAKADRLVFRNVDDSVDLSTKNALSRAAQVKAIRSTIAHLYLATLHKEVATDSEEVNIAFDLFMDVLQAGVDTGCNTGGSGKARDVREAWYAVLYFLLSDYRFVYS